MPLSFEEYHLHLSSKCFRFLTEIGEFYYKYGLSGKDRLFSILFMRIGLGRQLTGIGHILCMGHTVEYEEVSKFNLKRRRNVFL